MANIRSHNHDFRLLQNPVSLSNRHRPVNVPNYSLIEIELVRHFSPAAQLIRYECPERVKYDDAASRITKHLMQGQ